MDQYTLPAPLVQAVIATLLELPASKTFNILYDLKSTCDGQDRQRAQDEFNKQVQSAVDSATAQVQRA